jgi:hypothetical protein
MRNLKTRVSEPQTAPLTAKDGPLAAEVARELLTQPESGVTRISYVGLPAREAVQLVVNARDDGLQAQTTRGRSGRMSVTLSARPETPTSDDGETATIEAAAVAEASVARAAAPGTWQRAWARLWAGGHQVTCLLGRRTP